MKLIGFALVMLAGAWSAQANGEDAPKQNVRGLGKFKFTRNIPECHYDCDKDSDCAAGLLCADAHKAELRKAGLDERHAYCGSVTFANGNRFGDPDVREVCYNPKKV